MEGYRKVDTIGKGTYGMVYLCEKKRNNLKIVIKEVSVAMDSAGMKTATNEVEILKTLRHPNIIQYFRSFIHNNSFCMVMEFARKGNLHQLITKQRDQQTYMYEQEVLNIFCQVLHGLHHIHSKKIIHRDLKSENILITGFKCDIIKIADFGISKILKDSNETRTVIGTPNYLAPEVCDGKPYNVKSDIWALGCLLYEMCALERMFDGPITNIILSITSGLKKSINLSVYDMSTQELINIMTTMNPDYRPDTQQIANFSVLASTLLMIPVNFGGLQTPYRR